MALSDLTQLQRLGIDIWLPRNVANELIKSGSVNTLFNSEIGQPQRHPAEVRSHRRERSKSNKRNVSDVQPTHTVQNVDRRRKKTSQPSSPTSHEEQPATQPFHVALRVFLYGPASLAIDQSGQCSDEFMKDILLALCGFELHEFNELHFRFPVSGYGGRAVGNGTLTGAQESFQAWFREKVPRCTTFLAIGEAATATTALFAATESRVITIDTVPDTPMLKRQLWLKIQDLKG